MKITRSQLKEIIKEEIQKELSEQDIDYSRMYSDIDDLDAAEDLAGMSFARQTPASPEDLAVGKSSRSAKKRKLKEVQRLLNKLGAFDMNMKKLVVDGIPGPKTALVLSAVLPGLACRKYRRGKGCTGTVAALKNTNLLNAAIKNLKRMRPIEQGRMTDLVVAAMAEGQKDGTEPRTMMATPDPDMPDDENADVKRLKMMMDKAKKAGGKVVPIEAPITTLKRG